MAWSVSFVPKAVIDNRSLDYLVGPREEYWRHREADRPRGFEIDDQLEPRRLLHR